MDASALKQLRVSLQPYSLLYVEDNVGLNEQATILFRKIFENVYTAYEGVSALDLFREHRPSIVITDIIMPQMDGLTMSEAILHIDPEVKIIVTTAHDDREYLHKAIRIGVFDYLAKPMRIENLVETLSRCALVLKEELHRKIFNANLHSIFNYQNSLTILLQGQKVVMANQPCLEFFGVSTVEMLQHRFTSFGEMLLKHNSFLYNHEKVDWFAEVSRNPGKLFNVKMSGGDDNHHHFILRFQSIPDKEGYGVLSLNDVTELGLLKLYDATAIEQEKLAKDQKMVYGLLEMAMRNGVKIRAHNLYKGLSITNDALISEMSSEGVILKTAYVQLKAMQYEEGFYITSDLFPMAIYCNEITKMNLEEQNIHFSHYQMVQTSPTRRKAIRVMPDETLKLTLLYEGRKFETDIVVLDISINAVRLQLPSLPAGLEIKKEVGLDMVLTTSLRPVIINTAAEVYRIHPEKYRYEVVCMYDLHAQAQKSLIDYIAKRQMVLIREFKGKQYEK